MSFIFRKGDMIALEMSSQEKSDEDEKSLNQNQINNNNKGEYTNF